MCLESIIGITAKRHDNLKKLLVFFILIITSCNAIFAQFKSSDIIKASDMVLDLNSFKEAHMVLSSQGFPAKAMTNIGNIWLLIYLYIGLNIK